MPRGGGEVGIPRDLAVVVGVHVHPAGCDDESAGVELLTASARNGAYRADDAVVDCHVSMASHRPRAVDHAAAPDNEIVVAHVFLPAALQQSRGDDDSISSIVTTPLYRQRRVRKSGGLAGGGGGLGGPVRSG